MNTTITTTPDAFVGRDDELERIAGWLSEGRLVSVVGPPGAGKTRLSRELAQGHGVSDFAAVRFADLSDAHGAADVIDRLAELWDVSIEGQTAQERAESLASAVRDRPRELVILDNFETVLGAAATVLYWAQNLPHRFLVTSTTALDVRAEHVVRLGALPTAEAAQLFIERAFAERGRAANDADLASAERIADRLDGLPLAIELAARQADLFTIKELESQLDSALELLASGPRDAPARHRSLRAMVMWGWSHLTDEEQQVMQAAAVFEGGFRREALAAVLDKPTNELLGVLAQLRRKSMLSVEHLDDHARLMMLNTIGAFAREQLDRDTNNRGAYFVRHLRWLAGLARHWLDALHDPTRAARFESERANIVAAMRRAPSLAVDATVFDDALRLGLALRELHERRGVVPETAALLGELLDNALQGHDQGLAARLRAEYGELLRRAGDPRGVSEVETAVSQARTLDDPHALSRSLLIHAEILFGQGDREAGIAGYEEAVEAAVRSDDRRLELDARQSYVVAKHFVGEFDISEHEAVHTLAVQVEDPWIEATCLTNIGIYLRDEGRVDEAIPRFRTAIDRFRSLGDEATAGHVMLFLGVAQMFVEQFEEAETVLEQAREILEHRGPEVRQMAEVALARVAVARGDFKRADPMLAEIVRQAERDEALETEALTRIERYYIACVQRDRDRVLAELGELPDAQRVRSFEVHQHTRALHAVAHDISAVGTPALDALAEELRGEPAMRAFALLQRGVVASLADDNEGLRASLDTVRDDLTLHPSERFELRRWWRWLGGDQFQSGPRMLVEANCKRVCPPGGAWIDLSRKGRSRAVVRTLVDHRLEQPGEPISPEALFESAWPDTTIQHDSAMARVYTAISEIRKMGLADVIQRTDVGYLIASEVAIEKV